MKKLLIAAATGLTLSITNVAGAADLPSTITRAPAPLTRVAAYSWTGCYVGGGLTYGFWTQDLQPLAPGGVPAGVENTNGGRGWGGTVQGGCDYQFVGPWGGNLVVGLFGDYDWTSYSGTGVFSAAALVPGDVRGSEKMTSAWAAGGRLGVVPAAIPQLLVYVSGGYTQATFDPVTLFAGFSGAPIGTFLDQHTYSGYFIGSGYEYALSWLAPGLTWKTEYRYSDFGTDRLPELLVVNGSPNGFTKDSRMVVQTIRSELVWRFSTFWR